MYAYRSVAALGCAAVFALPGAALSQHEGHAAGPGAAPHEMWAAELGAGWRLLGMAQAFPIVTFGAPGEEGSPLRETEAYVTQSALMANVESPASRLVLRTTLNFEGVTQPDGELTFGGWGEGFIDKRHPHTLLHELMLSANFWEAGAARASVSAGKGFAPYGTDDPMARPGLKYPTNHHLSQVLERWTVSGAVLVGRWGLEAGVFGGAEPEDPYDLSNIRSFGDSWSARLTRRWGPGEGAGAAWEASASYASVVEEHDGEDETTRLWNVALRHAAAYRFGRAYFLAEFSRSHPEHDDGYYSLLGEAQVEVGPHQPYARLELATRPEYPRAGAPGTDEFFRYDHHAAAIGATRWTILSAGYGHVATRGAISIRPFVNAQLNIVARDRGPAALEPEALFGTDTFWTLSLGARLFLGGDPMRMGAYGVLDPMTAMNRAMAPAPGRPMEMEGAGNHHPR